MSRLTISLEPHLARQLDRLVLDRGYANRSAAVREMIRFGLDRADILGLSKSDCDRVCVAHVSFVCTHCESAIGERLLRVLHHYRVLVKGSNRVPLDDGFCLENVVLAGVGSEVQRCAEEIVALKGASSASVRVRPLYRGREGPSLEGADDVISIGQKVSRARC